MKTIICFVLGILLAWAIFMAVKGFLIAYKEEKDEN